MSVAATAVSVHTTPVAQLGLGDVVFVPHFMGEEVHNSRPGMWARIVGLPGQDPVRPDEFLMRRVPAAMGDTPFFEHIDGPVDVLR